MSDINLKIISAGAGSGKTFRLTSEMVALIKGGVRTSGIIATTFTQKAAAELQERVRVRLLENNLFAQANDLPNAMIGTVHSIGVKLLQRFAFEAGVSPEVGIMADSDAQIMFNNALATILTEAHTNRMEQLSTNLGFNKKDTYDWRRDIRQITDVARGNDFDAAVLDKSKQKSWETFADLLPPLGEITMQQALPQLVTEIEETIERLQTSGDATAKTQGAIKDLQSQKNNIKQHQKLAWHDWAKIAKADANVSVKSRPLMESLVDFATKHEQFADFQKDIKDYISLCFDLAKAAMTEFQHYKKQRGLIDYTDMEVLVKRLMELPEVEAVLREELDLLLVDEFQDTNPIQLAIFFKLSQLAKHSIWVGDPKQSIYGFRGADPRLMQAIIQARGGVKKEDIQEHSYRSRRDIVHATNAIFDRAFKELPTDQVALKAHESRPEYAEFSLALKHWHFNFEGEGREPGKDWFDLCIADTLRQKLQEGIYVIPKNQKKTRLAQPADIAILCRTNGECQAVADALHHVGLKAAIARVGLLATAEAKLMIAALKYMLHASDSLSVAEILVLASRMDTNELVENRLQYIASLTDNHDEYKWAEENFYIEKINELREKTREFSASELLNILIEELDLRRIIMKWGNVEQRLGNIDILRRMALEYEDACNRLQSAASLGGFLLWLGDVATADRDVQASGEQADAVNVLTYHKSKGLEWPITICHALEGELKDGIWGLAIIPEQTTVDLDDLLGKRWLRFWVNPYADQSNRTPLLQRIEESDAKAAARLAALEEEARLLYVGVTRARDYLIFPSRKKETKWLNRTWHKDGSVPTLDHERQETLWEWEKRFVPIEAEAFAYSRDIAMFDLQDADYTYFDARGGRHKQQNFHIDIENEALGYLHNIRAAQPVMYTATVALADNVNPALFAKALVAYHQSLVIQLDKEKAKTSFEALMQRLNFEGIDAKFYVQRVMDYEQFMEKQCKTTQIQKSVPVMHQVGERLFSTKIDELRITPFGLWIIKHDNYVGEKCRERAQEYATWVYFVRQAFAPQDVQCLVHFPFSAAVVALT